MLTRSNLSSKSRSTSSSSAKPDNSDANNQTSVVYKKIDPNTIIKVNDSWKYQTVNACVGENGKNCSTKLLINNNDGNPSKHECQEITKQNLQKNGTTKNSDNNNNKQSFSNRGLCLIFNNVNFSRSSRLTKRNGSEKDVQELNDTFTCLGYKVVIKRDRSTTDIW